MTWTPRSRPGIALHSTGEVMGTEVLTADERAVVAGARASRVAEYAAGRWCARRALAEVGHDASGSSLLADDDGVPTWPVGWTGSITHTGGWAGAVASRSGGPGGLVSLGIDAEPVGAVADDVLEVIATRSERGAVSTLAAAHPAVPWATVLHVAKEAAYKAWFPLGRSLLHHAEVLVELETSGSFRARVGPSDGTQLRIDGDWTRGPDVVVAVATLLGAEARRIGGSVEGR